MPTSPTPPWRLAMTYKTLLFEVRDHVAHITLNRPQSLNTLDADMARELMSAAIRCDEDSAVRAAVLTGAGNAFCGGGALKGFPAQGDNLPAHVKELTVYLHAAVSHWTRMDAPVITAVHGSAAGAGMSLALASDLVIAAESSRFVMA